MKILQSKDYHREVVFNNHNGVIVTILNEKTIYSLGSIIEFQGRRYEILEISYNEDHFKLFATSLEEEDEENIVILDFSTIKVLENNLIDSEGTRFSLGNTLYTYINKELKSFVFSIENLANFKEEKYFLSAKAAAVEKFMLEDCIIPEDFLSYATNVGTLTSGEYHKVKRVLKQFIKQIIK